MANDDEPDLSSRRFQVALDVMGDDTYVASVPRVIFALVAPAGTLSTGTPNETRERTFRLLSFNERMLRKNGVATRKLERMRAVTLDLIERWLDDPEGVMEEMEDPDAFGV